MTLSTVFKYSQIRQPFVTSSQDRSFNIGLKREV